MMTCVHCQDLLFDLVYGLIDEPEAATLRDHLAGCPACTAALANAKAGQARLARAARAVDSVPIFMQPLGDQATETPTIPAPSSPLDIPTEKRRGSSFAPLGWFASLAVAACLVVAVTLGWQQRTQYQEQAALVGKLEMANATIDAKLAGMAVTFTKAQKELPAELSREGLQLHVAGPAQALPGVSAAYQVALRDTAGNVKPGFVDVQFVDAKKQPVAEKQTFYVKNTTEIPVPAELAKRAGTVTLVASSKDANGKSVGKIEETITVREPAQATHLAVNKLLFKPGEKVQARALVLDRVTLKPAEAGQKVTFSVTNDAQQQVAPTTTTATLGGMAASELRLPANLPEGAYVLNCEGPQMQAMSRRFEVLPANAPAAEVLTQNNRFRAGEPIQQSLQLYNSDGKPAANTAVYGNFNVSEQRDGNYSRANIPFNGRTDANGQVQVTIPALKDAQNVNQQFKAELNYGPPKKEAKVQISNGLQVTPSKLVVDFFPEGGHLIAGVPNRVFYRVRAPFGDAVSPEGHVILLSSNEVIHDSDRAQGLGVFTFTPDPQETYTVRITAPMQDEIRNPFAALGIQKEGVLLRGDSVQPGDQPLKLTLENHGVPRTVQIVTTCRGQIIHHARVDLGLEPKSLAIPAQVDGLVRVTLLDVGEAGLTPHAERVFFRSPARTLNVNVDSGADKIPPGQNQLRLRVTGTDERQQPLAFWALASVVDDRFRGELAEPNLSAHFMLLGELPAEADLVDLPLLADATPGNRDALEVSLGVFGWRRFVPPGQGQNVIGRADLKKNAGEAANFSGLTFFHRVEPSLAELQRDHERKFQAAQIAMAERNETQQGELLRDRSVNSSALALARWELEDRAQKPLRTLLSALGLLALVLLAVGTLGMMYGLSRLVRRLPATGSFGTACACLAGCLVLLVFRPQDQVDGRNAQVALVKEKAPVEFHAKSMPASESRDKAKSVAQSGAIDLDGVTTVTEAAALAKAGAQPAAAEVQVRGNAVAKKNDYLVQGENLARLELSRNNLSRELKESEKLRDQTAKADRAVQLQPQAAVANMAGFGKGMNGAGAGGFGGANPAGPGIAPAVAPPNAPKFKIGEAGKTVVASPMPGANFTPNKNITAADAAGEAGTKAALDSLSDRAAKQKGQRIDLNQVARQLAARRSHELADSATLIWNPALHVPVQGAEVSVDLPGGPADYRVLFFGHTEDGRLGFFEGKLRIKDLGR